MASTTRARAKPRRQPQLALQTGGNYLVARQVMQSQRRAGASFNDAWQLAMKMVSKDDRSVLEQTRSAWEAAFHRQPFYSGASFGMLATVPTNTTTPHERR